MATALVSIVAVVMVNRRQRQLSYGSAKART